MTTNARFFLSCDPLKLDFVAFEKVIVDTDVVNDVTSSRQSVITRVVIRFFMTRSYPLNNSDVI